MKSETKKKISSIFSAEGITSEITCEQTSELCKIHHIDPFDMGEYCDAHQVKMKHFLFWCFK